MAVPFAALASIGVGVAQSIGGFMRRKQSPEYRMPSAVTTAVSLAAARVADPSLPGESAMYDKAQLAAANAIESARSAGILPESLAGISAGLTDANLGIGVEREKLQQEDIAKYEAALYQLGEYQDQEFQINKYAPYQDAYNESREMVGAGATNIIGGLQGREYAKYLDEILKNSPGMISSLTQDSEGIGKSGSAFGGSGYGGYFSPGYNKF